MATSQSIRRALDQLVEAVLEAEYLATTVADLSAYDPSQPAWVFVVGQQMRRIKAASEQVEREASRVLPALDQMEAA